MSGRKTARRSIFLALAGLGILFTACSAHSQTAEEKPYDPITLLEDLSSDLGKLKQFSFETTGMFDERDGDRHIKRVMTWSISVARPNRLVVKVVADDGETWLTDFDGIRAQIFYVGSKEYANIPFEGDITAFVDFADRSGLSKTPLNDFLRKDLFGDIERSIFDATLIAGYDDPDEADDLIHHVFYQIANTNWQLWIREDTERYTPHRSVVTYVNRLGSPEHVNEFRNWKFSTDVDAAAKAYGIPKNLEGWKKVDFVNPAV
ncbi:MAG: DUF2092 domain-containing protein, partial [Gammaproteobacteria bacterium]